MTFTFPEYTGTRCLMMPYIQGDSTSLPERFQAYAPFVDEYALEPGQIGFLTIDESPAKAGIPHRGARAKFGRALHTEAGMARGHYCWGTPRWGFNDNEWNVTLDFDTRVLLCNNIDSSCAVWDAVEHHTSPDGDIGDRAEQYPYEDAHFMDAGEVVEIGILTPHESMPLRTDSNRQFLRIVSSGVHGREPYFTSNPKVPWE